MRLQCGAASPSPALAMAFNEVIRPNIILASPPTAIRTRCHPCSDSMTRKSGKPDLGAVTPPRSGCRTHTSRTHPKGERSRTRGSIRWRACGSVLGRRIQSMTGRCVNPMAPFRAGIPATRLTSTDQRSVSGAAANPAMVETRKRCPGIPPRNGEGGPCEAWWVGLRRKITSPSSENSVNPLDLLREREFQHDPR